MKLKNLNISGVGGIDLLELKFNDGLNLICGANGIGKTTILECIAHAFGGFYSYNILKKKAGYSEGKVEIKVENDNRIIEQKFIKNGFHPYDSTEASQISEYSYFNCEIINIKTNRNLEYRKLEGVKSDLVKGKENLCQEANNGINIYDLKDWFVNRVLWSAHKGKLTEEQNSNLELAKSVFLELDSETEYCDVNHETYDILVKNRNSEIYLEYLSSGYKSALYILLGIIKEIELRFKEVKIKAKDFEGIILIDEIDLHLHPRWQANLVLTLKKIFSKAQIIATTHSPTIIQVAESEEIIALILDKDLKVKQKHIEGNYSFKGWTVEEILEDVMGLETLRSREYLNYISLFDVAIENENRNQAIELYKKLKRILHPRNPMLKLLRLELVDIGGLEEEC